METEQSLFLLAVQCSSNKKLLDNGNKTHSFKIGAYKIRSIFSVDTENIDIYVMCFNPIGRNICVEMGLEASYLPGGV